MNEGIYNLLLWLHGDFDCDFAERKDSTLIRLNCIVLWICSFNLNKGTTIK